MFVAPSTVECSKQFWMHMWHYLWNHLNLQLQVHMFICTSNPSQTLKDPPHRLNRCTVDSTSEKKAVRPLIELALPQEAACHVRGWRVGEFAQMTSQGSNVIPASHRESTDGDLGMVCRSWIVLNTGEIGHRVVNSTINSINPAFGMVRDGLSHPFMVIFSGEGYGLAR